jgi:hypothetical protein
VEQLNEDVDEVKEEDVEQLKEEVEDVDDVKEEEEYGYSLKESVDKL